MLPVEINFKLYTASDKMDVLHMMAAFYALNAYPFEQEVTEQNIEVLAQNPSLGRLYLIQDRDENVGYMALTFGFSFEYRGRDALIDEIYLKPAYQGQGIGAKAMEFLEAEAQQIGVHALHLEVETHNEKAKRLYAQQGFRSAKRSLLTKRLQ